MARSTSGSTGLAQQPTSTKSTTTQSRDPMADAGQQAGESIGRVTERVTDLGFRQADSRREQVSHGLEELAGGIRRVSSDMESQQPAVASIAQTAAEQTDRVARYLQETDTREMVHKVEDLARRQPLLFMGGAFLLGLAASRLLKASGGNGSSGREYGTGSRSRYGTSYDTGIGGEYRATGPGGATNDALAREGV